MYCATLAAADGRAGLSTSFCFKHRTYIIRNNVHSVKVAVVNSPLTPLAYCTASSTHTFASSSPSSAVPLAQKQTRNRCVARGAVFACEYDSILWMCHDSLAPRRAELCCVPDVGANEHAFYLR
jgi:hypothetical protein